MHKIWKRLPLQFRVLYRQFLLRVIDLESLSIHADIPRFLAQFASVLIFISIIAALGPIFFHDNARATPEAFLQFTWKSEQSLISGMMLIVGMIAIACWDSTFPDRQDALVLSPLPVAPRVVLFAKIAALASLLGIALLTLNFATGLVWPLILGAQHGSIWGVLQSFAAYWFTMIACSIFLFCCVLSIQGLTALALPRRVFLRLSAVLQIAAFGIFLGVYFVQPSLTEYVALTAPANHWIVAWSPPFWFFALFNQLNGSLPALLGWLAWRAWIGLSVAIAGAVLSLLLCYLHAMKKTIEEPDLVPAARGRRWRPNFGSPLQTAIVLFCVRSMARSRQHRLAFALYAALIAAFALPCLRTEIFNAGPYPLTADFLVATFMMMSFAVFGLRSVFSLPISLTANWVWRLTQLRPSQGYVAAVRRSLLYFAAFPVCILSAMLAFSFRPWSEVAAHLTVLALIGWIFVEFALIDFYKVPFTCAYLPGKVHVQVMFGCFLVLMMVVALTSSEFELPALGNLFRYACMMVVLVFGAIGVYLFNQRRSKYAVLYFEENPPEIITTLRLVSVRPNASNSGPSFER